MYMSIIELDQSHCIMSQPNQFNEEVIHQILLEALGYPSRVESNLLYRKDKNELCVYSEKPLNQDKLLMRNYIVRDVIEVGGLYDNIRNGDVVKLFFRAAPSRKLYDKRRKNSARVNLFAKSDRVDWVERKLSESGVVVMHDLCQLPLIIENGTQHISFRHFDHQKNKGNYELTVYDYIVTVQIKNRDLFMDRVKNGIGPYKSYGCGLILIGAA